MNEYKIIGISRPNNVKMVSSFTKKIVELPKRLARRLVDQGMIEIENPERLYTRI